MPHALLAWRETCGAEGPFCCACTTCGASKGYHIDIRAEGGLIVQSEHALKRKQAIFTAVISVIIVGLSVAVTGILQTMSDRTLTLHTLDLISSNATQVQMNVDSYLGNVKTVAALLFSDEAYYGFDATDPSLSDYDRLQAEEAIEDRIVDLGMMENFTDFAVVYANDETVGWVSQTTAALPEGNLYETFAAYLEGVPNQEAWHFGLAGATDRIYYVKRLNEHALVLVSFYSSELDSYFAVPSTISGMDVRLVSPKNQIIYSTGEDELGRSLPREIVDLVGDDDYAADYDEKNIATVDTLANGWRVVCSEPLSDLLADNYRLRSQTTIASVCIAVVALAVGVLLSTRFNRDVSTVVSDLSEAADADRMTGLLNKTAFRDAVNQSLAAHGGDRTVCFVMVDIDDFKRVNDTLGHQRGDEVICAVGKLLERSFADAPALIGRIGGDEFAVFLSYAPSEAAVARTEASRLVSGLLAAVDEEFGGEGAGGAEVSISVGVVVEGAGEHNFQTLYQRADAALYGSKNSGKGKATFL